MYLTADSLHFLLVKLTSLQEKGVAHFFSSPQPPVLSLLKKIKALIKIFENSLKHLLCLHAVSLFNIQTFINAHSCLDGTHTQKHTQT